MDVSVMLAEAEGEGEVFRGAAQSLNNTVPEKW